MRELYFVLMMKGLLLSFALSPPTRRPLVFPLPLTSFLTLNCSIGCACSSWHRVGLEKKIVLNCFPLVLLDYLFWQHFFSSSGGHAVKAPALNLFVYPERTGEKRERIDFVGRAASTVKTRIKVLLQVSSTTSTMTSSIHDKKRRRKDLDRLLCCNTRLVCFLSYILLLLLLKPLATLTLLYFLASLLLFLAI